MCWENDSYDFACELYYVIGKKQMRQISGCSMIEGYLRVVYREGFQFINNNLFLTVVFIPGFSTKIYSS